MVCEGVCAGKRLPREQGLHVHALLRLDRHTGRARLSVSPRHDQRALYARVNEACQGQWGTYSAPSQECQALLEDPVRPCLKEAGDTYENGRRVLSIRHVRPRPAGAQTLKRTGPEQFALKSTLWHI